MLYGACYYPEHWPEERWPTDATLMRKAGLNVVRIGEFSWSKLERRPGEYDFAWLDRAIRILEAEGIRVVLGTPTATPPKWLMDRHPDLYMRDAKGCVRGFGNRRHYCYNHEGYDALADGIVTKLAERYGRHPNVIAWQIDNEFGCTDTIRCYCDNCRDAFRRWLARKYGDIERLNESWGTVFWSHTYNDWDEIPLPAYTVFPMQNPGHQLDYFRFASASAVRFQQRQIEILRQLAPAQPVTHNLMGFFPEVDGFELSRELAFVAWDNYPNLHFDEQTDPRQPAIQHDMTWGLKRQPFWVMEQQSGSPGGNFIFAMPKPGEIRRWTYQAVAHGADAILYFRWRTCLFGAEQYWHGILPHDGHPGDRYEEVCRTGAELARMAGDWAGWGAEAEVALIRSYENEWAMDIQPQSFGHRYMAHFKRYYRYFYDGRIPVEVVSAEADFSRYRLVVVPHDLLTDPQTAARLYRYAAAGGAVVLDFRSGIKRPDNRMEERTLPGLYRELLGLRLSGYGSLRPGESRPVVLEPPGAEWETGGVQPSGSAWAASATERLGWSPAAGPAAEGFAVPLEPAVPRPEANAASAAADNFVVPPEPAFLRPETSTSSGAPVPGVSAPPSGFSGEVWYDRIELETAEPIAWFAADFFAGRPAATRNRYGRGLAYYIGTEPQDALMDALLGIVCREAGVRPIAGISAPAGVEIVRRTDGREEFLFVLNHEESSAAVTLEHPLTECVTRRVLDGTVTLAGQDVLVFRRTAELGARTGSDRPTEHGRR